MKISTISSNLLLMLCIIYPAPSQATAIYDLESGITVRVYGFLGAIDEKAGPETLETEEIDGDAIDYAFESHTSKDDLATNIALRAIPTSSLISDLYSITHLDAHGEASKPYGYAWTEGAAEAGWRFKLSNDRDIVIDVEQDVHLQVSTSDIGESAYARLQYSVLIDGKLLTENVGSDEEPHYITLDPVDVTVASVDGVCITARCEWSPGDPSWTSSYHATAGWHTIFIDPRFASTRDDARVPEPPTLGLVCLALAGLVCGRRKTTLAIWDMAIEDRPRIS